MAGPRRSRMSGPGTDCSGSCQTGSLTIPFFRLPNGTFDRTAKKSRRNLFTRQSECHLIKLSKTIALHAYATII